MSRKKYIYGGHTYLIAEEDLKLYPGAVLAKDKAKPKPIKEEPAVESEEKAEKEPKNKARKTVKNKTAKE